MRILLRVMCLGVCLLVSQGELRAQPVAGSQLSPDENACAMCHGEADLWEEDQARLFISEEKLATDVHFLAGVNCHDCHGGDPSLFDAGDIHAAEDGFLASFDEVWKACAKCHEKETSEMTAGVHGQTPEASEPGREIPLDCIACHGPEAHGMLSVRESRSSVYLDNQVRLCGNCHEEDRDTYVENEHGHALVHSGLSVTAVCSDCHGAHGIYPASDDRSTLHPKNAGATCGQCHRFIEERLQKSVHGRQQGTEEAEETEGEASDEEVRQKPSCTDCHQGHESPSPRSVRFRLAVPNRCGNCHADLSSGYAISMHGELTELGYGPAATCSDCHGVHDILPVSDPDSKLSSANRLKTCQECHPMAVGRFADFDPHADHRNPDRDPVLYWVYMGLMTILISTMGFFGLHSVLWLIRGLIDVAKNGRPKRLVPGGVAYVRFKPFHRVAHTVMVLSFLGLALTGLPLKYSQSDWAKPLAYALGGFESTAVAHRIFGLVNIGCLVLYTFRMLGRFLAGPAGGGSRWGVVFGPDSPVPVPRDLRDLVKMFRWFFGLGPKPTFDRWSYWEKVDFWGACADIVIIGATGLILWFPALFCAYLPGGVLNIAKVIHSTQALLATGFVFAIHFFSTHVRPEKFPMDTAVLTGLVSEEELEEERPEYLQRMRREGRLDELRTTVPPRDVLLFIKLGGFVALSIGLALLAGIVWGVLGG